MKRILLICVIGLGIVASFALPTVAAADDNLRLTIENEFLKALMSVQVTPDQAKDLLSIVQQQKALRSEYDQKLNDLLTKQQESILSGDEDQSASLEREATVLKQKLALSLKSNLLDIHTALTADQEAKLMSLLRAKAAELHSGPLASRLNDGQPIRARLNAEVSASSVAKEALPMVVQKLTDMAKIAAEKGADPERVREALRQRIDRLGKGDSAAATDQDVQAGQERAEEQKSVAATGSRPDKSSQAADDRQAGRSAMLDKAARLRAFAKNAAPGAGRIVSGRRMVVRRGWMAGRTLGSGLFGLLGGDSSLVEDAMISALEKLAAK